MAPVAKRVSKRPAAQQQPRQFTHLSLFEKGLLEKWHGEGKTASAVADSLGRDLSVAARHFKRMDSGEVSPRAGRPPALTPEDEAKVVKTASGLIEAADSEWQVTAAMVREALKLQCCDRVILEALHKHNIYFHNMREKPVRTEEDERERAAFGRKYEKKPASFWSTSVDAFLDNKFFPVFLNGPARAMARKRTARGTFRAPGQGLAKGHTKPPKKFKPGYGKHVQVAVAISAKKVLTCHVVKGKWSGEAARQMYTDSLGPALRRLRPHKRRFLVLEDNDPTGYKSGAGISAKEALKIDVLELPRRSPDLNPLDYSFWAEVNQRLRAQEAKYADGFKETRKAFEARLKRTILRVPASAQEDDPSGACLGLGPNGALNEAPVRRSQGSQGRQLRRVMPFHK